MPHTNPPCVRAIARTYAFALRAAKRHEALIAVESGREWDPSLPPLTRVAEYMRRKRRLRKAHYGAKIAHDIKMQFYMEGITRLRTLHRITHNQAARWFDDLVQQALYECRVRDLPGNHSTHLAAAG